MLGNIKKLSSKVVGLLLKQSEIWRRKLKYLSIHLQKNVLVKCVQQKNVVAVAKCIREQLSITTRHHSRQWAFHPLLWCEFSEKKKFALKPFKVQLVQQLKPVGHPNCLHFANRAENLLTEDDDSYFQMKHIFTFVIMWTTKIASSGENDENSVCHHEKANTSTTNHCSEWILFWWHYRPTFLWKLWRSQRNNAELYRAMLTVWFSDQIEAVDMDKLRESNNLQKECCKLVSSELRFASSGKL